MKTIGMIGGMSWESTTTYYQIVNRAIQARLGGVHSAKIILESYDFAEMAAFQKEGRWDDARVMMEATGRKLARAGADFVMICCNTMHLLAADVEKAAGAALAREDFAAAMAALPSLRAPVDAFFDKVTVNADDRELRANRLRLLSQIRRTLAQVADFARIEG